MGTGGVMGTGGALGIGGMVVVDGGPADGGGDAAAGPCSGLCAPAIELTVAGGYHSANLGTEATCHETTSTILGGGCANLTAPRTFSVNGTQVSCGANFAPPAARNGGYCFQASAGGLSYATFFVF
jgi:hypothetical protein